MLGKRVRVERHLGRGKSGDSYLATLDGDRVVAKYLHDERVPYYESGGVTAKFDAELSAYETLRTRGVPVPRVIATDRAAGLIVKTWIDGPTVAEEAAAVPFRDRDFAPAFALADHCEATGINLDWFPTNFVQSGGELWYVDYELNGFSLEWSFRQWGIWYWVNSAGMAEFLRTGNPGVINRDPDRGLPVTQGLEGRVSQLLRRFGDRP